MKFDVCVIGSGAGGALCALALQKKHISVAILEKGNWVSRNRDPLSSFQHAYRDQGFVSSLGNTLIGIPTGQVVGGTTVINSGTWFPPPPSLFEEWKRDLHLSLSYEEMAPYFTQLKELFSIQKVSEEIISQGNKLFKEGLEKLGFYDSFVLDRAEKGCVGSGRCPFICPISAKQSIDVSILPKFLDQKGTLLTHTNVYKIVEEKNKVILYAKDSHQKNIKIECSYLIIAGGSLSSPLLVRKNKLGTHWKKAGDHLSIHPAVKVLAQFSKPVHGWQGVPQALGFKHPEFPRLSFEGVFTPSQLASMVLPLEGEKLDDWLSQYDHVASFGVFVKDLSRGKVRCYPALGLWIYYHLNREDFLNLVEGARFMGLTYLAAGAKKIVLPFTGIQNEFLDSKELRYFSFSSLQPSQLYTMGFHPLGTCGITRVVDENLKIYGSQRIFISDGSVIPSSLGVNPQVTIMAFALRLGNNILKYFRAG